MGFAAPRGVEITTRRRSIVRSPAGLGAPQSRGPIDTTLVMTVARGINGRTVLWRLGNSCRSAANFASRNFGKSGVL